MLMVEEDFEHLFREWEASGHDPKQMRETQVAIAAMETGDHTPPPPSRLREPTLILPPALHEGINEAPEGKFYLPPFGRPKGHHFNVGDIAQKLYRTRVWVAILTMYAISATVVAVWNW